MKPNPAQDETVAYRWSRWKLFERLIIGLVMFLIFGFFLRALWQMPFSFDIWTVGLAVLAFPLCVVLTAMGVYVFVQAFLLLPSRRPALILDRDGLAYFRAFTLLPPFQLMSYMRIPFLRVWYIEKQALEFQGQNGDMLNVSYQLDGMLKSKILNIDPNLIKAERGEVEARLKETWKARKQEEPFDWTTQRW